MPRQQTLPRYQAPPTAPLRANSSRPLQERPAPAGGNALVTFDAQLAKQQERGPPKAKPVGVGESEMGKAGRPATRKSLGWGAGAGEPPLQTGSLS